MSQPKRQHLSLVGADANQVGRVPTLDGFRLVEPLGPGSEGGAWRAIDERDGATVVAKSVPAGADRAVRRAFDTLRRIGSANLPAPRALPHDEHGGRWLVTDWVPGQPLRAGPVELAVALREAAAVARALAALHEAGTFHGDVAPGNVVVRGERTTLIDLAQLGRRGTGTPGFLAPEVLAGGGGPAADRFSLGALVVWRLCGEAPWTRPDAVVQVHGRSDVVARLRALGLGELPAGVLELLVRLLLPDPSARPASTADVARRLADFAAAPDEVVAGRLRWWPPVRWPYCGLALDGVTEALARRRTRLVVVAGPSGAGRDRVVEAVVLALQAQGQASVRMDAEVWAHREHDTRGSWLEAWVGAAPDAAVAGLVMEPVAIEAVPRIEAATRLAQARVVVPATEEAGRALEGTAGVIVVWPRPLTEPEAVRLLGAAVAGAADDVAEVARVLLEVTGGWPAALVRAAWACAQEDVSVREVRQVAMRAGASAPEMDAATASAVLQAAWSGTADLALPATLAPRGLPHAMACARARARLGPRRVFEDARRFDAGEGSTLAWAIDARDDAALEAALRGAQPGGAEVSRAVETLRDREAPASLLAVAASARLGDGDAQQAERIAARGGSDGACRFVRARALQRLGRAEEAGALLTEVASDDAALRWAKRGLLWRLDVDQGRAAEAADTALAVGVDDASVDVGVASALLWAAYAAALTEDAALAERRLERAEAWLRAEPDPEAAGLLGRVLQLQGNLAHGRDALGDAARLYAQAADAFAAAGEPVGGLTLRGTSCALAVLTLDIEAGLEHGRAALRGLLAHGQTSALLEAALNLVQLLARVGAGEEARAIAEAVDVAVGEDGPPLLLARRARLRADVAAATLATRPSRAEVQRVAAAYAGAAGALEQAEQDGEATDAWLRAASLLSVAGRAPAALRVLERARTRASSDDAQWAAIAVLVAVRAGDGHMVDAGLQRMRAHGNASSQRARGRLDLSILFDRALSAALRACRHAPARRHAVAHRLLSSVELVMQKTRPNDRPAVRSSLLADGGDAQALRDLLEDLEAPAPEAPVAAPPPVAPGDDRYARLLRMYRRFAREDRLEPLLEQVVDAVMELTDAERGAVVVRRPGGDDLSVTRELSEGSEGASYSRSVIARVLESGEPVLSVDAAADERFDDSRSISHLNLRSVLAVPLRFRGELLGAAYVDHRLRRGNFGEDDLEHMEAFADLAALAVAHAAALADLEHKTEALTTSSQQLSALLEQREAEVLALREDARRQAPPSDGYRGIIGASARMQAVFRLVDRVADADVPVVVYGESGTGKELVARALHDAGGRASGPFVAENCGAIPETLLESVLFGHAKGAFTGAQKAKPGLFEAADGGTIFLDEVSEMSMPMQTKLLRVLQEGEVRRVGETAPRRVDVRVVAASNRDLEHMVEDGSFRRDLYYRINVVRIDLPALRDRPEDIDALIEHFFARHGASPLRLAPSVARALRSYAWPGNVRQLENEVQRWIALCEGAVALEDLSPAIIGVSESDPLDPDDLRIRPRVERMERELIARALEKTGNNQTQAAQLLGLSRYGLQKKLKRLEVDPHQS